MAHSLTSRDHHRGDRTSCCRNAVFGSDATIFKFFSQPRLEESLRAGNPDFDTLREKILVEHLVGVEKMHPFSDLVIELTATVTNKTARTITGMELRAAIVDSQRFARPRAHGCGYPGKANG